MAIFRSLVLASLLLSTSASYGQEVGRFQIISATLSDPKDGKAEPSLFKIDTVTGDVWKLDRTWGPTSDGAVMLIEGWSLINSTLEESIQQYQKVKEAFKDRR